MYIRTPCMTAGAVAILSADKNGETCGTAVGHVGIPTETHVWLGD
jgi:hypothetical protein